MVSNISVMSLKKYSPNFCAEKQNDNLSAADKFISDIEKTVKKTEKGDFFSKYLWSPTAIITGLIPILGYEIYALFKSYSLRKIGDVVGSQAFKKTILKNSSLYILGGILLAGGLQYLFGKNSDKKYEDFKQKFKDINTQTGARLRDKQIRSSYIGAMCSSVGEEITFNKNLVLDPLTKFELKKLIKHELVHAKQYETIARSKDGIKKLNYAVLKSFAKNMDNPKSKSEIKEIYNEIQNDKTGKYDNVTLHLIGADVDFKKFAQGVHSVLIENNEDYNKLPVVLDEKHYQKIVDEKGKLSKEEEEKADLYYTALLNYPKINFWTTMNPFSSYYNNILEKEAYKENPNLMTFINRIFVKQ